MDNNYALILRSINRSRVRRDILQMLSKIHPHGSYPSEMAKTIGTVPSIVLEALRGMNRYSTSYSLISLGLVEVEQLNGQKYYTLTEKGLAITHHLKFTDIHTYVYTR